MNLSYWTMTKEIFATQQVVRSTKANWASHPARGFYLIFISLKLTEELCR